MNVPCRVATRSLAVLALILIVATTSDVSAQALPAQAEVRVLSGRVEVLRRGQPQWVPAAIGMRLDEGDEIRAWGGASAELELADGSQILIAENTRLAVTKVAVDAQSGGRLGVFHLAVGKVRASLGQSAIQLVRNRRSNFAITTPGGVAAARGTIFVVGYDAVAAQTLVAVVRGQVAFIDCITGNFRNLSVNQYVTLTGNQPMSGIQPTAQLPEAIQKALDAPANPGTAGQAAIDRAPPNTCADFTNVITLLTRVGLIAGRPPGRFGPDPGPVSTFTPGREFIPCSSPPCPGQ